VPGVRDQPCESLGRQVRSRQLNQCWSCIGKHPGHDGVRGITINSCTVYIYKYTAIFLLQFVAACLLAIESAGSARCVAYAHLTRTRSRLVLGITDEVADVDANMDAPVLVAAASVVGAAVLEFGANVNAGWPRLVVVETGAAIPSPCGNGTPSCCVTFAV
jgi:hypothetical protein